MGLALRDYFPEDSDVFAPAEGELSPEDVELPVQQRLRHHLPRAKQWNAYMRRRIEIIERGGERFLEDARKVSARDVTAAAREFLDLESTLRRDWQLANWNDRKKLKRARQSKNIAYAEILQESMQARKLGLEALKEIRRGLTAIRDESQYPCGKKQYAKSWKDYLKSLGKPDSEISKALAANVRMMWGGLKDVADPPTAFPSENGFTLAWDDGLGYLEIEIFPEGLYDWFYRSRDTDSFECGEGLSLADELPARVLDLTRLLSLKP